MLLFTNLDSFRPDSRTPLILFLGNFDGLHEGHKTLLAHGIKQAHAKNGKTAILTFREHPQQVLHPEKMPSLLTSIGHRLFLFEQFGIDYCFLLPFTKEFSQLDGAAFVEEILVKRFKVHEVCLGSHARFGHDRKGDAAMMKTLAEKFGFLFTEIPEVKIAGEFVSSSRIRALLESGRLDEASRCLGRPYSALAKVVKGEGRGRAIGYPTANLASEERLMIPGGVYPVTVRTVALNQRSVDGEKVKEFGVGKIGPWLHGVLNYGHRPTFHPSSEKYVAEVFILDFEGDLYDQTLEVALYPQLRQEKKFPSAQALKEQIDRDVQAAREFFQEPGKKNFTKIGG